MLLIGRDSASLSIPRPIPNGPVRVHVWGVVSSLLEATRALGADIVLLRSSSTRVRCRGGRRAPSPASKGRLLRPPRDRTRQVREVLDAAPCGCLARRTTFPLYSCLAMEFGLRAKSSWRPVAVSVGDERPRSSLHRE